MKILITGASGFIGRQIVARLSGTGIEPVLVGRDVGKLRELYPDHTCINYEVLRSAAAGADMLVHMAVRNNDQPGDLGAFVRANVDFTLDVLAAARAAGVRKFVALSSVQVFTGDPDDPYVRSKQMMEAALQGETGIEITVLHLPLVYGEVFAGRLRRLNSLPGWVQRPLFACLAALKPTLHVAKLAQHIRDGGQSAILSDGQAGNPVFRLAKRMVDLGFALVVIGLFWWLLLSLWAAVRFSSPGPGIFAQTRLGKRQKPFVLYKFRTMAQGTAQAGTHEVSAAFVTPVGRFLRASKLDELPQVWNILRGEISLIGPRPGLPSQIELREARARHGVFEVTPGISGLAQVEGLDMSQPERLARRDADYIALQSLLLDLRVALATLRGKGSGDRTAG